MSQNIVYLNSAKALDVSQVERALSNPEGDVVMSLPPVKPEGSQAFLCRSNKAKEGIKNSKLCTQKLFNFNTIFTGK